MQTPLKILLADDDAIFIAPFLTSRMSPGEIRLKYVTTAIEAVEEIANRPFDAILLDINFGHGRTTGVEVIARIREAQPQIKIVMLSGQDDEMTVLRCLELGADDFLSKSPEQLPQVAEYLVSMARDRVKAESEAIAAKNIAAEVGAAFTSQLMQDVFNKVMIARRNPHLPVLITGSTGVGKDLVARAISVGLNRPRVDVDCGAIPENLIESEFFGHTKGSFTGATTNKVGKFQAADRGDLFLDEIGNLKRGAQERFLRAIQNGEITPVGSTVPQKVQVRVIAATNENFDDMVKSGRFRQDLLERLKGVWIEIPDLRSRPEDIESIVRLLLSKSKQKEWTISSTCLAILRAYEWPGNIRELESTLTEMMANCSSNQLSILHLPERLKGRLLKNVRRSDDAASEVTEGTILSSGRRAYALPTDGELGNVFDTFLQQYLPERFQKLGSHRSQAELAKSLGIARNTLSGYLRRLKIALPIDEAVQ